MSSLSKIIQIERTIGIYRNDDDGVEEEIVIDISLEDLKSIVVAKDDDPELYEGYILNDQQLEQINTHLENKIIPDFNLYYYVLEATGIYDWSAN